MNIEFQEKQRFTQWWIWILLLGITLIPLVGICKQIIFGEQFGDSPLPDWGLLLFLFFMLAAMTFFWKIHLTTHINSQSIEIIFFPFTRQNIQWTDVAEAKVVTYGFVGGWGIRLGTQYGTVYNTSGKIGLAIQLKNGKKICIGTQKGNELNEIVKAAMQSQHDRATD